MRAFNAVIIPSLLYGCETWATTKQHIERLEKFQMACLRRVVGLTRYDHVRNVTLRAMVNQPLVDPVASVFFIEADRVLISRH